MASLKAILLFLLFSFVVGHSAIPHHHHQRGASDLSHHNDHEHDQGQDHDHGHNAFSFSQIEHTFLNAKTVHLPIVLSIRETLCFLPEQIEISHVKHFAVDVLPTSSVFSDTNLFRGPPSI